MTGNSKVLTGLMERRALEAIFTALSEATSAAELAHQADEIAKSPRAALPILIARLDTEDPQLRGGLGEVAKRLDREGVVGALQGVLRSRERSQIARLSAATILDRYLGEPIDESALMGLGDPEAVAIRSLNELIAAMEDDETAVLEYLSQLAAQPPETPGLILAAIPRMAPHRHLITLLRVFAQDTDPRRAQEAIEQLGRLRMPEALVALETLTPTLPLALSRLTDRAARKLRMSGMCAADAPTARWRTLLSPVDGAGVQVIWFIRPAQKQITEAQLTFVVRDPEGIVAFYGAHQAPGAELPPERPIGSVSTLPMADGGPVLHLVETSFDAGRHAVRTALARHWADGTFPPLAYRFWNALLWNAPEPTEEETRLPVAEHSPAVLAALLDHPAFAGWFWRDEAVVDAARHLGLHPSAAARASTIAKLAALHFGQATSAGYGRRLDAMTRWLSLAGQPEAADLASALCEHLAVTPPAESLFVRRLIGISLDIAAVSTPIRRT